MLVLNQTSQDDTPSNEPLSYEFLGLEAGSTNGTGSLRERGDSQTGERTSTCLWVTETHRDVSGLPGAS